MEKHLKKGDLFWFDISLHEFIGYEGSHAIVFDLENETERKLPLTRTVLMATPLEIIKWKNRKGIPDRTIPF